MAPTSSDAGRLDDDSSDAATIVLEGRELTLVIAWLVGLWALAFALGFLAAQRPTGFREAPFDEPPPARAGHWSVVMIDSEEPKHGTRSGTP